MSRNNHLKGRIQRARFDRECGRRGAHIKLARQYAHCFPGCAVVGTKVMGNSTHRFIRLEA